MKDYILYVDDNEVNLRLFAEYLSDSYEVIIETTPQQAWESLSHYPIKVLVSDLRMPDEDGLTFLNRVHQTYPDIIKILCTAYADEVSAIKAINQGGIFHYISKPYSYEYMLETIHHAINEYNLRQENKRLIKELQRNNSIIQQAFNQIKEQQLKLFTIFDQSSDGIVVFRNNEVLEANPAFQKIFSITAKEKILATCSRIMQDNYSDFMEKLMQEASAQNSFEYEVTCLANKRRYLEVRPNMIDFLGEKAILAVIRDITERREAEQKVMEAIIATQENEQRRYARELHDGIGPLLSTLKMYVEWIANPQATNTQEIINYALQTIDEAIRQAKTLSNQMSSHLLERYGLVQAIDDFLKKTTNAFGITYQFNAQLSSRLPSSVETALYRILLEAINNTLKYARACHISIEVSNEKNRINVIYRDNGIGFDYNKTINDSKGMGLFNIQNRVQALKGHCIFNTRPGEGFEMQVYLPINE